MSPKQSLSRFHFFWLEISAERVTNTIWVVTKSPLILISPHEPGGHLMSWGTISSAGAKLGVYKRLYRYSFCLDYKWMRKTKADKWWEGTLCTATHLVTLSITSAPPSDLPGTKSQWVFDSALNKLCWLALINSNCWLQRREEVWRNETIYVYIPIVYWRESLVRMRCGHAEASHSCLAVIIFITLVAMTTALVQSLKTIYCASRG